MVYIIKKRRVMFCILVCFLLMLLYLASNKTDSDAAATKRADAIGSVIVDD